MAGYNQLSSHLMVFLPLLRESDYSVEFDYFLRGKESMRIDAKVPDVEGLTKDQVQSLTLTSVHPESI